MFIEPQASENEPDTHASLTSRNSRQPVEPRDTLGLHSQKLNPDILSNGSYSSPTPISFQTSTRSAPLAPRSESESPPAENPPAVGRVINRNYLQVQANNYHNRANTLTSGAHLKSLGRIGTSQVNLQEAVNTNPPKRTRSISRSVRNLFNKSTGHRDKSYDSSSVHNANNLASYDLNSGEYIKAYSKNNPIVSYPVLPTVLPLTLLN